MNQLLDSISIIIPTRNESCLIRQFLATIPREVELVVVDASDDDTPAVIKQLRPANTTLIRSRAHIAAARQIGAAAARGDWLVFSDADVVFEPGYFERVHAYFTGDALYGPKYATINHTVYSTCFNSGQQICDVLGIPAASGSNMAVRRRVFEAVGGFRRDLPVNEDTELFLRLAHHGYRITYAPDLAVRSLDDRRLALGSTRKMLHSACRTALLWANLYIPLPKRWLCHDWGYWRKTRYQELAK
ncbi:MAG: glycosyltransferase [Chloroflexi bacterium AL-W]|nr:glycosyltransferase [Chloroflexi bacterium AL-N1]NOK65517.1 glycosyltransferase [Chloroflexi bacterium AL-N10]NOK74541.1 glycosyltransferase [Chloroflexi bacterium AL-N5]NOK80551.1 glycosyltransferase [Chloroflexi bacterium AL-W]NOK88799.1 glycosyltransferase [Chloroflexi bacterium AL-N15]